MRIQPKLHPFGSHGAMGDFFSDLLSAGQKALQSAGGAALNSVGQQIANVPAVQAAAADQAQLTAAQAVIAQTKATLASVQKNKYYFIAGAAVIGLGAGYYFYTKKKK